MKTKNFLKAFFSLMLPLLAFIALKIIDNLMGDGIPLIEYCLVCLVVIVLMASSFLVVAVSVTKIDEILDHKYNETNCSTTEKCPQACKTSPTGNKTQTRYNDVSTCLGPTRPC